MSNTLAVIVPMKNEIGYVGNCLSALLSGSNAALIDEVIVVDNYSSDGSFDLVKTYPVKCVRESGTVARIRNIGASITDAAFIGFVDADVAVSANWADVVHREIKRFDTFGDRNMIIGKACGVPVDANWVARTWFGSINQRNAPAYINSGNMVISRSTFDRLGGFNADLSSGEDVDLCERAKHIGATVVQVPEMEAVHYGYPETLVSFFRRERWHGREMLKYSRSVLKNKPLAMAVTTGAMLIGIAGAGFAARPGVIALICLTYWSALYALAAFRLKTSRLESATPLAILFAIYGAARLVALIDGSIDTVSRLHKGSAEVDSK